MRELISGLGMFALFAAASFVAIEQLDDRETVVPPPDAVAEQFTRLVMAKRWDPARDFLENPESLSDDELEAMQKQLGEGENVDAEVVSRDDQEAIVTVRVPSRHYVKNFALTFDREWVIRE